MIDTFIEVESGKNNERPELEKALHLANLIARLEARPFNASNGLTN